MKRKAAIALSAVVVVGAPLLTALTVACSRRSEPSAGASQASAQGSAGAPTAPAGDAGARIQWPTEEDPHWQVGVPLRPVDHDIIAALNSGTVARSAFSDVFPDKPYKVRFAGNAETENIAFVLVDLNRDDQWDERWDLTKPGTLERVAFHDPAVGNQKEIYTLVKGRWQPH